MSGSELIGGIFKPMNDDEWVPLKDAKRVFLTGPTHTRKLIEQGLIPRPVSFGPRLHGWTGAQINAYRRKLAEQHQKAEQQNSK